MSIVRVFLAAVVLPLGLTACQMAQTGSSSFAGANLAGDPVKAETVSTKPSPKFLPNEAASLIVKPEDRAQKPVSVKPKFFENEAASLIVKKPQTKASVTIRQGSDASERVANKKAKVKSTGPSSRKRYQNLIAKHAKANGVPVRLALAVVQVESNYRANARGRAGEIGLMQLMPRTARYIGYSGKMKHLYNPDTNIRYGMKYLSKAHKLGGGSVCGTILKYNAGHGARKMNPISRKYCQRVKQIMKQL